MAPTDRNTVELQTSLIIKCLFEDDDLLRRVQLDNCVETDGPDDFDPIEVAGKLKHIADSLNDDLAFKAALNELRQAVAQEFQREFSAFVRTATRRKTHFETVNRAAEAAFSHGVEALCQTQVTQRAEVAPEMQLIRASVALGLYIKKSSPELKNKVQHAMAAFLNRRVGTWVAQQGGWGNVASN